MKQGKEQVGLVRNGESKFNMLNYFIISIQRTVYIKCWIVPSEDFWAFCLTNFSGKFMDREVVHMIWNEAWKDFFFFNTILFSLPLSDETIFFPKIQQEQTLNQYLLTGEGSSHAPKVHSVHVFSYITFNNDGVNSSQDFCSLHIILLSPFLWSWISE